MGMAAPTYYTADMVRAMPDDGNRYETVHGELLVTPSPKLWHQEVVFRLHVALSEYLSEQPVGHALHSPADISWGDDTLVQPDLFVAALPRLIQGFVRPGQDVVDGFVLRPDRRHADDDGRCQVRTIVQRRAQPGSAWPATIHRPRRFPAPQSLTSYGSCAVPFARTASTRPATRCSSWQRVHRKSHPGGWTPPRPRDILRTGESKFLLWGRSEEEDESA